MSKSELLFPRYALASVYSVLSPISELRKKTGIGASPQLSPPVRVGPLEFRIVSQFRTPITVVNELRCYNAAKGFPWKGSVDAAFKGRFGAGDTGRFSMSVSNNGEEWNVQGAEVAIQADQDTVIVEVGLTLKIGIMMGADDEAEIPYMILKSIGSRPPFEFLLDSPAADSQIESKEGVKLPFHSYVLAANLHLLRTLVEVFGREGMERAGAERLLKIPDLSTKSLKIARKFLYSGIIMEEMGDLAGHSVEDFLELVAAAEKYKLPLLGKLAGVALLMRCNKGNAIAMNQSLLKYHTTMKETLMSLTEFIAANIVEIASAREQQNAN